jgi:DNA polymerase I
VWDSGDSNKLDFMAEYCATDARACLELAKHFLYLQTELSKLLHMTLFDVSRATASQLVETLLLRKAFERNELVPNKPSGSEIAAREREPVQGAFVKMPFPGVYENIAVLDFKSLYPSIIISHNVDASTFNCDCCTREEGFISPQGHKFCAKHKGIIPEVLASVLSERTKVKSALKNVPRDSQEYQLLYARQWGLKIFANSMYGLMLHPRFRWYSRAAGESTTAWGRHYIQETIRKAEESGFNVLYTDTDSTFILFKPGDEEKIKEFQRAINKELPERMELELEGFYPRGIFVSKKQEAEKGEIGRAHV